MDAIQGAVAAIGGRNTLGAHCTSRANGIGQLLQHLDRRLPADAGVGDADTLLETRGTLGRHLLSTLVDVGLDHDANNAGLAFAELVANGLGHLGLVAVVFEGVAWIEELAEVGIL